MWKMHNGEYMLEIFDFGMNSDVPTFKVSVFRSDFEFWIEVIVVDIQSQILLTILSSIDHS